MKQALEGNQEIEGRAEIPIRRTAAYAGMTAYRGGQIAAIKKAGIEYSRREHSIPAFSQ